MRTPALRSTTTPARSPAFIVGNRRLGTGDTRKILRFNAGDMACYPLGFLGMGGGRDLCLLLRERTGLHHHKPAILLAQATIRILHVDTADDTLAAPASEPLLVGATGFFESDREGRLLLSPSLQFLPHRTRTRYPCDQSDRLLDTEA